MAFLLLLLYSRMQIIWTLFINYVTLQKCIMTTKQIRTLPRYMYFLYDKADKIFIYLNTKKYIYDNSVCVCVCVCVSSHH